MKNLAGNKDCDKYIRDELERAGITVVDADNHGSEVQYSIGGELEKIKFRRAWYYWVATGPVPLEIAKEMYDHPEGKRTVRVRGDCTCPSPEHPRIDWLDDEGKEIITYSQLEKEKCPKEMIDRFIADPKYHVVGSMMVMRKIGKQYVTMYHIDDQAGLLLFALMVSGRISDVG